MWQTTTQTRIPASLIERFQKLNHPSIHKFIRALILRLVGNGLFFIYSFIPIKRTHQANIPFGHTPFLVRRIATRLYANQRERKRGATKSILFVFSNSPCIVFLCKNVSLLLRDSSSRWLKFHEEIHFCIMCILLFWFSCSKSPFPLALNDFS